MLYVDSCCRMSSVWRVLRADFSLYLGTSGFVFMTVLACLMISVYIGFLLVRCLVFSMS